MTNIIENIKPIVKNVRGEFTVVQIDSLTEKIKTTDSFKDKNNHFYDFIKSCVFTNPQNAIFVNGTCILPSTMTDSRVSFTEGTKLMLSMKEHWKVVESYENLRILLSSDEKEVVCIFKIFEKDSHSYRVSKQSSTKLIEYESDVMTEDELIYRFNISF